MLKIIPIQTKEEQEVLMTRCHIPYRVECMAYAAFVEDTLVGGAQFYLQNRACYITDIRSPDGVSDDDALFIMGRSLLNFVDMWGIHDAYIAFPDDNADSHFDKKLLARIGFWKQDDGKEYMNLRGFFTDHKH